MTFDEVVGLADKAYPDGLMKSSDGLTEFIYRELKGTYDAAASEEVQVMEAVRVLGVVRREIEAVEHAFKRESDSLATIRLWKLLEGESDSLVTKPTKVDLYAQWNTTCPRCSNGVLLKGKITMEGSKSDKCQLKLRRMKGMKDVIVGESSSEGLVDV
jgi:DNA-directed RNA polymerase subunit RPC12/RpoP